MSCLGHAERRAGGDADLLAHQVDAGHRLGDRMLDLQAGVHLDEVELAVLVEELHGAGAAVLELAHRRGGQLADHPALLGVQRRRGGLFQHLLVAALQRAVALAEMHAGSHAVAQHLDLDMARMVEILLEIDRIVAEGGLGLGAGEREGLGRRVGVVDDLHAASAAAGDRLDQHRPADLAAERHHLVERSRPVPASRGPAAGRAPGRSAWPRSCRPSCGCAAASGR